MRTGATPVVRPDLASGLRAERPGGLADPTRGHRRVPGRRRLPGRPGDALRRHPGVVDRARSLVRHPRAGVLRGPDRSCGAARDLPHTREVQLHRSTGQRRRGHEVRNRQHGPARGRVRFAGHDNVGHQLKRLTNEISELFEALSVKQRVVERAVRDRQTLNNYQAAMAQLLFEGKTEKLGIVLSRYPDLARFLQKNIHKLVPIHAAFKEYLNSKPSLLQEPIPIDEMLAMADFKYAAIAKQRERVEAEIKDRDARLMEKRIYIFDAYRLGFELYEKGEYREALLRLMAGAESLHYSSLLKSGEMIANGEGCRAHPELACLYLQAAVVFAGSKEQKTTTIKVLTNVYRVVICGEQKEMEAANDGIDKRAGDFRVVFNDLKKHIFQLGDNPALRLYNLGESYLVLYKTVLDEDKHIKEMANSNLANACQYFESAYRYADSQRKRYCIMYINIIEEDPDKDEGEYAQGITLALEKKYAEQGANKVEDILQQRIELKEKYIDAVKIQVKVMDKMSEEIKSIYERIGISEDGLLIIELAKKIKLSLPAYVECPTVSNRGL